jgi:putative transposase
MKYAFMDGHRAEFCVGVMCQVLGVSRSGYCDWRHRDRATDLERLKLVKAMEDIWRSSGRTYGSPRIWRQLRALGFRCSKTTVERLMREHGIRSKTKRKYKPTTDAKHSLPVAPNRIGRNFTASGPDRLWMSDITYLWTKEGWLYLAVVLDAYSRKIVGFSMNERMTQQLVIDALEMAVGRRNPQRGLIAHSDRGSQYASRAYQQRLWRYGMLCSMSRKGDCWDNAPTESFFHTLKTEHVFHEAFDTREAARSSVFEWIEVFYNRSRMHSSLGYLSPECYERQSLVGCT